MVFADKRGKVYLDLSDRGEEGEGPGREWMERLLGERPEIDRLALRGMLLDSLSEGTVR